MTSEPSADEAPAGRAAEAEQGGDFLRHTLPVGTQIGGLEIRGLIGEGGFGIVYLAFDGTLQRQVALKEYMPSSLASRSATSSNVSVKSPRFNDTFAAGLRSFVNEARLLAHFDHPALVKVHQFWQANRTAYMVMPYYQGPTLKSHLSAMAAQGQTPDEATLRQWLAPLLDALELMHAERCYHRDVAPDNILLTANGPLLLDFGAARHVISDMTHALTVMLKPGYAPIEQYGDAASMAQGPWTDLYALGSVVYFAITGHAPITSVERVMGDPLPSLASIAATRYSGVFLCAVDAALAVRPKDRPQSVAAFRALLAGAPVVPARREAQPAAPERSEPLRLEPREAARLPGTAEPVPGRRPWRLAGLFGLVLMLGFSLAFVARRVAGPGSDAGKPQVLQPPLAATPELATAPGPAPPQAAPTGTAAAQAPAKAPGTATEPKRGEPAATPARSAATGARPKAAASDQAPAARPVPAPARPALPVAPRPSPAAALAVEKPGVPAPQVEPAVPKVAAKPARCGEILQRGNQQALSTDDVAFLRKECR